MDHSVEPTLAWTAGTVAEAGAGVVAAASILSGIVMVVLTCRAFLAAGVNLSYIEATALVAIAKQIVSRRDGHEALLLHSVIGMQLLREFTISLLDLGLGCALWHT
ncbi:hypothetical protein SAMN05444415_11748 [Salipiger profundus]|nr:hypothetical protein SAMN05444415_11748 [Salipiger profundus]